MTEVIYLHDRRHHTASPEINPVQEAATDADARRAALYDMLRLLGKAVRTSEMRIEEKTEFASAALKVLGPDWRLSGPTN